MMNDKKINILAEQISAAITASLAEVMKPVFNNLSNEIRSLQQSLEQRQKESMKLMADEFIKEMKKSSDILFDTVSRNAIEISREQAKSVDRLAGIVERINADVGVYSKLSEENTRLHESIRQMSNTFDLRINALTKVSENIAGIESSVNNNMIVEKELADKLSTCSGSVLNTVNESTQKLNDSAAEILSRIEECTTRLTDTTVKLKASYEGTKELITKSFDEYQGNVNKGIEDTFASFDSNMSAIVKTLSDAVQEISVLSMNIPKAIKGSVDELQKTLDAKL